jgi:hypothetical protein
MHNGQLQSVKFFNNGLSKSQKQTQYHVIDFPIEDNPAGFVTEFESQYALVTSKQLFGFQRFNRIEA